MKKILVNLLLVIVTSTPFAVVAQSITDGIQYMDNDKNQLAKQTFSIILSSAPNNAEVLFHLGTVYYKLGQKDSAKFFFNKGIAANNAIPDNYAGLGKIMLDENNVAQAKTYFDKALSLAGPKDPHTMMMVADAYVHAEKNRDAAQAIQLLTKATAFDKRNPALYILLGDAYLLNVDGGGNALSNYELASELDPKSAKPFIKIGQLYIRSRNPEESLKAFQQALNADSSFLPLYREFGEFYYLAKKYEKAKEYYQRYIREADYNIDYMTRYVYILFLSKDYAATTQVVNELIKLDSSNNILNRLVGYSYYEQKKFQEGLVFMEKFLSKVDTKKIIASDFEYYGKILLNTGKDSLGIVNLQKAMAMDSTRNDLYAEIGQAYYKKKKYTDAAKSYELKLASTKGNAQDYFYLGTAWYYAGDSAKADTAFSYVIELAPRSTVGYLWKGRTGALLDPRLKTGAAKPFYEKLIEVAMSTDSVKYKKDLIEAYSYLGYYFLQKEDDCGAKEKYTQVLALDPENKDAKKVLADVKCSK